MPLLDPLITLIRAKFRTKGTPEHTANGPTRAEEAREVLEKMVTAFRFTPIVTNQFGNHPGLATSAEAWEYVLRKLQTLAPVAPGQPAQGQVDDVTNTFSALLVPGFIALVQYEGFGWPGVAGIVPLTSENAYMQNGRIYLKGLTGPIGIGEVGFRVAASGSQPAGPFVLNKEPFTGPVAETGSITFLDVQGSDAISTFTVTAS
ncbi:hypothetical protein [Hymenobacter pini]|uniref:hypothetical protein n=1 Tax=Hymenobacter pini TaxID=2880879 RepID=UPI001CF5EC06|nr:hypothetical protein [Hymenobacter pini]MCA8829426.1 hypothetical protein [Hymenobacter pini]